MRDEPVAVPAQFLAPALNTLTQVDSGPGLVVCEPRVSGADRTTAAFGAGCSRWLQFWLAGQGELGRTPLWSSIENARRGLGRPDFRLSTAEARRLPQFLGVTHAVVGEVRGSAGSTSLTLALLDLTNGREQGPDIRLVGSQARVTERLPGAAREIARRLGVQTPRLPARPTEDTATLTFAGRLPWQPGEVSRAELDEMDARSRRSALVSLLFLFNRAAVRDNGLLSDVTGLLDKQAPDHPLVLAEAGRQFTQASAGTAGVGILAKSLKRFPDNYLYASAATYYHRPLQDFAASQRAALHAVRCASRNPEAWTILKGAYSSHSNAIRQGRTIDQLQPGELAFLEQSYAYELTLVERAAELAPEHPLTYHTLCTSAMFAGDEELADRAFWQGLRARRNHPDLLALGMELYHPKWYGNPTKAAKVIALARSEARKAGGRWSRPERVEVALRCHLLGDRKAAQEIVRGPLERKALANLAEAHREEQVEPGRADGDPMDARPAGGTQTF